MSHRPCLHMEGGDTANKTTGRQALHTAENDCGIYIVPSDDAQWSAVFSGQQEDPNAIRLCDEQAYPVEVFYRRIDLNGSSMVDSVMCKDRSELLSHLNWVGACRFPVISFWGYDAGSHEDERLWELFEAGYRKRAEIAQEEMAEMDDGFTEI